MPIYKLENDKIMELQKTTFSNEKIDEVRCLQKFIINSIDIIEKDLFVLSSEFGDWEDSKRRIDILCLDKNANLVVIELKRTEDGGHMELQAIRYAAMVSNMTFENAVNAYHKYIDNNNLGIENPEEAILNFLEWDAAYEDKFAEDVRIILVSADFSKEVTSSVLWLLDRDVDIKCIRIKPQRDGDNLYLDIQQIIPLPETSDYQVKLREKVAEQRQSRRESSRDFSRFDITVNGKSGENLNKRQTIHFVINECVRFGISPQELLKVTGEKRWIWVDKECLTKQEFESADIKNVRTYDHSRWFNTDNELIRFDGKTYAFSNQHGKDTYELVRNIFKQYPGLQGEIRFASLG